MTTVAVIPARLGSTRLPRKVLLEIGGKPMIQRVFERVSRARGFREVIVATDSDEVERACLRFTGAVVRTSPECRSGSDRAAEVASRLTDDVIAVVQGDEPLIDVGLLERLCEVCRDSAVDIASACYPLDNTRRVLDPNVVKVVTDMRGDALYFSRSPIPWPATKPEADQGGPNHLGHIGVYFYRRAVLCELAGLPPSPAELAERLEQLRALQHGFRIRMVRGAYHGPSVDTADELDVVRELIGGEST